MEIRNSGDIWEDSGVNELLNEMELKKYFDEKFYGNNEVKFFFVVNCLQFEAKLRKRFDSKDKVLYWDVILDYETVKKASIQEKKIILSNSIINSFDILDKYKKLGLNKEAIKGDAKKYFEELGWL
jgi:hypothetical protein